MNTIPIEQVDEVWDRLNNVGEPEARKMAQHGQELQPYLMIYLLAMDENVMDENDRGRLMELGAVILQVMYDANPTLRRVTDKDVEAAEAANVKYLQNLDEESEMAQFAEVESLLAGYNQMPLLGAVMEGLMVGYEEEPEMVPENIGLALLYLKTVIDCLDQ